MIGDIVEKKEKVSVLLSTYNGELFLDEQIKSIICQKDVSVSVIARDDGSTDATLEILKKYESDSFTVLEGKNVGFKKSFLTLIKETSADSDYVAFSDQDDVWLNDKLLSAITKLKEYDDIPAIYSSGQILVNKDLEYIDLCVEVPETQLGSAIIKNYAVGCTVVFNKKLLIELKKFNSIYEYPHDWLANVVCLAVGGVSIYDDTPHIYYRQHGNNQIGAKAGFVKKWKNRIKKYFQSKHNRDMFCKDILNIYHNELNETSYAILSKISDYKKAKFTLLSDKDFKMNKFSYRVAFFVMVLTEKL